MSSSVLLLIPGNDSGGDYVECLERRLMLFVEGDTAEANSFVCGDTV
jgi:hypothetical protein